MDLKTCIPYLQPHEIIHTLDKTINLLNEIADKYDVFKMKTRTNASYMIVAGLHDQSNTVSNDISSLLVRQDNTFFSSLFYFLLFDVFSQENSVPMTTNKIRIVHWDLMLQKLLLIYHVNCSI